MTKKRKIILIGLAVTLALSVGVGGLVYAQFEPYFDHANVGGNKLLGVGEMGYDTYSVGGIHLVNTNGNGGFDQDQWWDTQFIVTNPNCERELTIEWVALIAGEDVWVKDNGGYYAWYAEDVIYEGTPDDWEGFVPPYLTPHEVWQFSIVDFIADYKVYDRENVQSDFSLSKYTLEITWSGARYTGWWWWGYWRSGRPLTGWQKEKHLYILQWGEDFPGVTISEAEMKILPSSTRLEPREPYLPYPSPFPP